MQKGLIHENLTKFFQPSIRKVILSIAAIPGVWLGISILFYVFDIFENTLNRGGFSLPFKIVNFILAYFISSSALYLKNTAMKVLVIIFIVISSFLGIIFFSFLGRIVS